MTTSSAITVLIAPVYLSTILCFFFLGIVLTKAHQYFMQYPEDPIIFKLLVGFVTALSLAHSCVWPAWGYDWLISHFGDPTVFATVPVAFVFANLCVIHNTLAVQSFFAWRIYKLSRASWGAFWSAIIPGIICVSTIAQWVPLVILAQTILADRAFADVHLYLGTWWCVTSMVGDVLITSTLVYLLLWKTRNNMVSSRGLLRGIIYRSVQTNIASLLFQVSAFIFLQIASGLWYLLSTGSIPQIYAFSLIISLTSRPTSAEGGSNPGRTMDDAKRSLKIQVDTQSTRIVDQHSESVRPRDRQYQAYEIQLEERKMESV